MNANNESKNSILASIRQNLEASLVFDKSYHRHEYSSFNKSQIFVEVPVIDRFSASLEAVLGTCLVVKNESEAREKISEIIADCGAKKIVISNSELLKNILPNDIEFLENADKTQLFESDLGITSAQFAIAETGTLVLESDRENHRLISLVPPIHLCILEAKNIKQTLGEVLEATSKNLSKTITFITGASRTSDIELTLAIGVHGPGELFVIVIDNV